MPTVGPGDTEPVRSSGLLLRGLRDRIYGSVCESLRIKSRVPGNHRH